MGRTVARLLVLLLASTGLLSPAALATTYYIASNGSDSNTSAQAQSKATPWAHLPGMPTCTANCASFRPQPGDRFILRGGDTWGASNMRINWTWSGTSTGCVLPYGSGATSTCIYIGVDPTWYSGGAWARPVFDCQLQTSCTGVGNYPSFSVGWMVQLNGSYVTMDNIEFKGIYVDSVGSAQPSDMSMVRLVTTNIEVAHCYFHGWGHTATNPAYNTIEAINSYTGGGGSALAGTMAHDNVVDGSDAAPAPDQTQGIDNVDHIYNNVLRYVDFGIGVLANDIHGNLVEHTVLHFTNSNLGGPEHADGIMQHGLLYGTVGYLYNNIVRHTDGAGTPDFWVVANSDCSTCTHYVYNNLIYDNSQGQSQIALGPHPSVGNGGTFYVFNNSVVSYGLPCMGNGETPPHSTAYYSNNHCITTYGAICNTMGTTCNNDGTNLMASTLEANYYPESSDSPLALSPENPSAAGVGAGTNYTSDCATWGTALCSAGAYVSYDAVNHKVIPPPTPTARPSSPTRWDIGAFQYDLQAPTPPSGLAAVVQ